jgi:hypothetical protein
MYGDTPRVLRRLSMSLDNVGQIERALGNLEAADGAWRESLGIARQLSRAFTDHPEFQRDLAQIEARANAPIEQT